MPAVQKTRSPRRGRFPIHIPIRRSGRCTESCRFPLDCPADRPTTEGDSGRRKTPGKTSRKITARHPSIRFFRGAGSRSENRHNWRVRRRLPARISGRLSRLRNKTRRFVQNHCDRRAPLFLLFPGCDPSPLFRRTESRDRRISAEIRQALLRLPSACPSDIRKESDRCTAHCWRYRFCPVHPVGRRNGRLFSDDGSNVR